MNKLFGLVLLCCCVGCTDHSSTNHNALVSKKLVCPEGVTSEYSNWGPHGLQEVCKLKHGPFIAAENGRVVLEGEYKLGKPSGTWRWYDNTGKLQKTETY